MAVIPTIPFNQIDLDYFGNGNIVQSKIFAHGTFFATGLNVLQVFVPETNKILLFAPTDTNLAAYLEIGIPDIFGSIAYFPIPAGKNTLINISPEIGNSGNFTAEGKNYNLANPIVYYILLT